MYVIVSHHITDPTSFQATTQNAAIPEHLTLHQILPGQDGVRAVCLWEGPNEEAVRTFVEDSVGAYSDNTYIPVAADHAVGLPAAKS